MEAITLQIVVGLIGLFTLWLKEYLAKDRTYDNTQDLRNKVVNGDVGAVQSVIDRVLVEANSPTGSQSDADTAKRLGDVLGENVVLK